MNNDITLGTMECIYDIATEIHHQVEEYKEFSSDLEGCLYHIKGSLRALSYVIEGLEGEIYEEKEDCAFGNRIDECIEMR